MRARAPGASTSVRTTSIRGAVLPRALDQRSHSILAPVHSPVYPVPNSNLGNGNLRPETFDHMRANEARRWSKSLSRPTAARRKPRECRAILQTQEIMPICADFLVERRGFEPMAIGARRDLWD